MALPSTATVRRLLAVVGLTALMAVAVSAPASAEQQTSASTPSATAYSMSIESDVPVPNMFGFSLEEATLALEAWGLVVGRIRHVPVGICEYIGLVVGQNPAADTYVPAGSRVDLIIGKQPPFPCRIG